MEEEMEITNRLQNKLTTDKTVNILKRALDYESANQQIISGNMANVDTPGYRQMSLRFDEQLLRAEANSSKSLTRTNSRHIAGSVSDSVSGFSVEEKKTAGIDLDNEMADMTKNNLLYSANTRLLSKKLQNLKAAIKGKY
jgi:flagellar basal-body rod protein FlgB